MVRRYAGDEARWIVIFGGYDAPRRGLFGGRREPATETVEVTRVTVIDAIALDGEDAAGRWLAEAVEDAAVADARVETALVEVNRALHAQRLSASDPYVVEIDRRRPLVTRVGWGTGDDVADGRWSQAQVVPRPKPSRESLLVSPQERVAALLGARDAALACEHLALRARADLDRGRSREAALQLRIALDAALIELESFRDLAAMPPRLDELASLRAGVEAVAAAALQGGLQPADEDTITTTLTRLESALRARHT